MKTEEMLQRSIAYEEAVLRSYLKYAESTESPQINQLYSDMVKEKADQIEKLRSLLKGYCQP